MELLSFIATALLVALGVWMLTTESLVVKLLAIIPLLGGFATLIDSLAGLHMPSWLTSAAMVTVFTVWGIRITMHKGLVAKILGGIALIVALFAILDMFDVTNISFVEEVLNNTYEWVGKIFSSANTAYSGAR